MRQYIDLVRDVLEDGSCRVDRTGTGTISCFGRQVRYDLRDAHVYLDHVEVLRGQLEREPYTLPRLLLPAGRHPIEYEASDIQLAGYQCHPPIRLEVSV